MEPPLDLERFATLSAELHGGTQRDELCAREGISLAEWNASQEAWLSRLADETAVKRFVLTNRYNTAFVARRRALAHGPRFPSHKPVAARTPEPPVPRAPPPADIAPPPPVVVSLPALAPEPPVYREPPPAYRAAEPPVYREPEPPAHRAVKAPTMAMPAFTEPVGAPLPFVPASGAASMTESATLSGPSPLAQAREVLPFKPAAPGEPSRSPEIAARTADPNDSGTVTGVSPFASAAPPLPFHPVAPPAAVAPAPPRVVKPAAAPSPPVDGSSTVYGAISPFAAQGPALPFQGVAAPAPAPAQAATPRSSVGLPFQRSAGAPTPAAPVAPAAPAGGPSGPSGPGAAPRLTLEQFASLTAEIAVNPRGAAQIRARYGFDEAAHRAEAEAHNRRFTADKALYARYMELFQAYREYVARAPR